MERTFRRSIDSLPEIFDVIDGFLAGTTMNEEARFAVKFSVEELFTNLVKYNPASRMDIALEMTMRPGEVAVSLTDDDAEPFDLNKTEEVRIDRPLAERRPGGLGIHLVKKLMDRIDYEYADRRSKTTFIKKLG